MIEAFRVGAVSRGKTLWEGLDLALGDGEIWVVAGPPSCGKTVLMNILRGERRPDLGEPFRQYLESLDLKVGVNT